MVRATDADEGPAPASTRILTLFRMAAFQPFSGGGAVHQP
jgi:hypothetical protein